MSSTIIIQDELLEQYLKNAKKNKKKRKTICNSSMLSKTHCYDSKAVLVTSRSSDAFF